MNDKTFVRFLEEIAGKDKLKVSFPLTEFMQWADIPFDELESVFADVNRILRVFMCNVRTFEEQLVYWEKRTWTVIVPSFTTIGMLIEVEFGEWTKDVRDKEGWLLGLLRKQGK
nr:MAG TPA: hypothetical protein [Caudoviricetes sp.]